MIVGQQLRPMEQRLISSFRSQINRDRDKLSALLDRLAAFEEKSRFRIDLLKEDNSKAIFVFTFVTAVFLPLSFITSYLSMNTANIRDMSNTQSIF